MRSRHAIVGLVLIFVFSACGRQSANETGSAIEPAVATDTAAHEAAVATLFSVWNTKEYDRLDSVMAPGIRRVAPDQNAENRDEIKAFMRQVHTAYPDFRLEMNESAFKGDLAFIRWTVTATHSGEGSVPATGKSIEISGMTLNRFEDGMLAEEMVYYDTATLEAQLEVEGVPHTR